MRQLHSDPVKSMRIMAQQYNKRLPREVVSGWIQLVDKTAGPGGPLLVAAFTEVDVLLYLRFLEAGSNVMYVDATGKIAVRVVRWLHMPLGMQHQHCMCGKRHCLGGQLVNVRGISTL